MWPCMGGLSGERELCDSDRWWRNELLGMLSAALTLPGMGQMQMLLNKHEDLNGVSLKTGTSERYGVSPTREDSFNSNSGTCETIQIRVA